MDGYNFPEIIAVTETWFEKGIDVDMFGHGLYNVFQRSRATDLHGGVALFVKNGISAEVLHCSTSMELLWVKVFVRNCVYVSGTYYRPHVYLSDEVDSLRTEYLKIMNENKKATIFLVGDFNLPDVNWCTNFAPSTHRQDEFVQLFAEFGLYQIVTEPTRGNKILDLLLTSEPNAIMDVKICPPLGRSDHNVVFCQFNTGNDASFSDMFDLILCWNRADWAKFREFFNEVNWWEIFTTEDFLDIELCWNKFEINKN